MTEATFAASAAISIPSHPVLYEINTWVWLHDLSVKYNARLTLATVPAAEWDAIGALGFDAVWLMGVWERSPAGRAIALHSDDLLAEFRRVLPDFTASDVAGSPYCIRNYEVDAALGGRTGLAAARAALAERGLALLLDFVPNHVAPDHPWTLSHPEYFMHGTNEELARLPEEFLAVQGNIYARGRDPYFAPWQDVVQLNGFAPDLRQQMITTLLDIAAQCDGLRCDMAMLMNTDIFTQTWGKRAGAPPKTEYWTEIFATLKQAHPRFTWIAEVYWDMEWQMQQLGFDYCYDKRLYDRLVVANLGAPATVEPIAEHLQAEIGYQNRLVRFVENHDEPRATAAFPPERLRAVTLVATTQPGARLFHEGQLEGRRTKVTVFLGRRPQESPDLALLAWSQRLIAALRHPVFHQGAWRLCSVQPAENVLAWCWHDEASQTLALAIVNLGDAPARVQVAAELPGLTTSWELNDLLSDVEGPLHINGEALTTEGIALNLLPWDAQLLVSF